MLYQLSYERPFFEVTCVLWLWSGRLITAPSQKPSRNLGPLQDLLNILNTGGRCRARGRVFFPFLFPRRALAPAQGTDPSKCGPRFFATSIFWKGFFSTSVFCFFSTSVFAYCDAAKNLRNAIEKGFTAHRCCEKPCTESVQGFRPHRCW